MVIPQSVVRALLEAGVVVHPLASDVVELVAAAEPNGPGVTVHVKRWTGPLPKVALQEAISRAAAERDAATHEAATPAAADVLGLGPTAGDGSRGPMRRLFIAATASEGMLELTRAAGWSVVLTGRKDRDDRDVRGFVQLRDRTVTLGRAEPAPVQPRAKRGPKPYGTYALMRHLLLGDVRTQQALAAAAGVSQPAVSQRMSEFVERGWVSRRDGRHGLPRPVDVRAVVDWWLDTYPGPGGVSTYWFGLDRPEDQVRAVVNALGPGTQVLVSGDVAVDRIAPWRRPTRAVLYIRGVDDQDRAPVDEPHLTPAVLDAEGAASYGQALRVAKSSGAAGAEAAEGTGAALGASDRLLRFVNPAAAAQEQHPVRALSGRDRPLDPPSPGPRVRGWTRADHVRRVADPAVAGLTPSGPEEATLELVLPADWGVWSGAGPRQGDLPLADLLQVAWDLRRAPAPDRDQALEHLMPVVYEQAELAQERGNDRADANRLRHVNQDIEDAREHARESAREQDRVRRS